MYIRRHLWCSGFVLGGSRVLYTIQQYACTCLDMQEYVLKHSWMWFSHRITMHRSDGHMDCLPMTRSPDPENFRKACRWFTKSLTGSPSRDIWINALNQLSRIGSKPHYRRCSMLGMHSLRPSSGSTVVAAMWRIACTDGSSNGWFSQLGRHL